MVIPAPVAHGIEHFRARSKRGYDHGNLPFLAGFHVRFDPVVGLVNDLVDRERCCPAIGVRTVVRGEFFRDLMQPFVQQCLRPSVQGRETADDPRLALRDDQFRPRDDEQRGTDQRQAQVIERGRGGASGSPLRGSASARAGR